jgi:hypothetical protein
MSDFALVQWLEKGSPCSTVAVNLIENEENKELIVQKKYKVTWTDGQKFEAILLMVSSREK